MKRLLSLSVAVAALALAPGALAAQSPHAFTGTVVSKTRGGLLVARSNGTVALVRRSRARVGDRVVVSTSGLRILGLTNAARIRGIVVAHRSGGFVLAAANRLMLVRTSGRRLASATDNGGPQVGDVVGVVVSIDAQGNITATSTEDDGPAGTSTVQATVTAVGTDTITLDVNGESVTLQLPSGATTLPAIGAQVNLTLTFSNGQTTASEDDQGEDNSSTTGTSQGSGDQSGQGDQGSQQQSGGGDDQSGSSGDSGSGSTSQSGSGDGGSGGGDG